MNSNNLFNVRQGYPWVSSLSIPIGYLPANKINPYFEPMDKYEKRRLKLKELIASECGGINAELARRIKREPSYINRLLYVEGKNGKKRLADDLIEVIEDEFKLPRGWFDADADNKIYTTQNPDKKAIIETILDISDNPESAKIIERLSKNLLVWMSSPVILDSLTCDKCPQYEEVDYKAMSEDELINYIAYLNSEVDKAKSQLSAKLSIKQTDNLSLENSQRLKKNKQQ